MLRTTLRPLRSTIGPNMALIAVTETGRSSAAGGVSVQVKQTSASALTADPDLAAFLPAGYWPTIGSPTTSPGEGVSTLPLSPDLPMQPDDPCFMLSALGPYVDPKDDVSRQFWIDFTLQLDPRAAGPIGGIIYSGYPYLPYRLTPQGENSANFGLPREFRLSFGASGTPFIDADSAITHQAPAAHSGFHVLPTGPLPLSRETVIRLRVSDFPRLLFPDATRGDLCERWGFLIPFLYVFQHREHSRYHARVPAGLLAAVHKPASLSASYLPRLADGHADPTIDPGVAADRVHVLPNSGGFVPLSAAAVVGPRRRYHLGNYGFFERFVSNRVAPGGRVLLWVEQTEQYDRCIAGVRLTTTPPPGPVPGLDQSPVPFGVEVFEVDAREGGSPLRPETDPAEDRYALRLCTCGSADADTAGILVCRFVRASMSRQFLIALTSLGEGHITLAGVELVQSASVVVAPRPTRSVEVQAVGFRLMGPELAADYARLGQAGLGFTVERLVGGDRREVLFQAETLLDLLEMGAVRLHRNQRYWEVIEEVALQHARSTGWQRREAGEGVPGPTIEGPGFAGVSFEPPASPAHARAFDVFGTQEVRTHTEHIGFEPNSDDDLRDRISELNDLIKDVLGPSSPFLVIPVETRLSNGFDGRWRGVDLGRVRNVSGMRQICLPPLGALAIDALTRASTLISSLDQPPRDAAAFKDTVTGLVKDLSAAFLLSGASPSIGVSGAFYVGVNGGIGFGQAIPMASRTVATGQTGTIQLQSSSIGYQYSQSHGAGFEASRTGRRVLDRKRRRTSGAEVAWQGEYLDIVSGRIPVGMVLPATGGRVYDTVDQAVRVRFGNGVDPSVKVDVWFEIREEMVPDDH